MTSWSRSILVVGCLVVAGLVATGFWLGAEQAYIPHLLVGLGVTLLALFAHVWVLLFLLATGRLLARGAREGVVPDDVLAQAARLRRRCWPWLGAAVVVVMASFITGGGVSTHYISPRVHRTAFWAALVFQAVALWVEGRSLAAHDRLMARVKGSLA